MSRFTRYAATSQTLSLVAMEEASRRGLREADLADLFLALTLSDQPAGRVLRELGITLHAGRAVVKEYQEEQIASLGITASLPPTGDIAFHETGGYAWSKRALKVIRSAGKKGRTADAAAVLRELLDEPSGVVVDLLERLTTTPTMILAGLDATPAGATEKRNAPSRRRGELIGVSESFIPAQIQDVWALLSDPARIPEWEPAIGAVDTPDTTPATHAPPRNAVPASKEWGSAGDQPQVGAAWTARTQRVHPNGKPLKVHERFHRRTVELLQATPTTRLVWRFSYPDASSSPLVTMTFDLMATTDGTELVITMALAPLRGRRALLSPVASPARRFLTWIRLNQISGSISRTFRQTESPQSPQPGTSEV